MWSTEHDIEDILCNSTRLEKYLNLPANSINMTALTDILCQENITMLLRNVQKTFDMSDMDEQV